MKQQNQMHLVLKTKLFDMIKSGEKIFEYRDDTDYWNKRIKSFLDKNGVPYETTSAYGTFLKANSQDIQRKNLQIVFHKGYTNETLTMEILHMYFAIPTPQEAHLEAKPGEYCFIFTVHPLTNKNYD